MVIFALSPCLLVRYARYSAKQIMGPGVPTRQDKYRRMEEFAFANLDKYDSSSLVATYIRRHYYSECFFKMGTRLFMRGPIMLVMACHICL